MNLRAFGLLFLSTALLLAGCSGEEASQEGGESPEQPKKKQEVKIPEASKDPEEMMKQNPGKYSGKNYDEQKVQQELDKMPDKMTTEEASNRLVHLLGENYQTEYQKLQAFNTDISSHVETPDGEEEPAIGFETMNVAIVLDASGSMAGQVEGGTKMDLAKEAVKSFASELPKGTKVSLRVYGHKGSNQKKDKAASCNSNEVVYPMQAYDSASFSQALTKFSPTGWTPLAAAIEAAGKDLQKGSQENARNVVYVVSDGEETCGGDPVKAGKELKKSGIEPMVHIVGFDVEDQGQKQLMKVGEAADGDYKDVYTESDLKSYLETERERMKMEWANWSTKSQNDIYDNWAKKYREMEDIIFNKGLAVIKNREIERMYKAKRYLGKKSKTNADDLESEISKRELRIGLFLSDKRSEITAELDEKRKEAIKATEEKEKKMKGYL